MVHLVDLSKSAEYSGKGDRGICVHRNAIGEPPSDVRLERAFLYGFLAGTPSPYLPPRAVLDYHENQDLDIKAAFESGHDLAEQVNKWNHDLAHGYYDEPLREISKRLLSLVDHCGSSS